LYRYFTGALPRRQLGALLEKFDAEVAAAAAAAGAALVPPAAVPAMSKPQADAITGRVGTVSRSVHATTFLFFLYPVKPKVHVSVCSVTLIQNV
jgi:hypothetical protein